MVLGRFPVKPTLPSCVPIFVVRFPPFLPLAIVAARRLLLIRPGRTHEGFCRYKEHKESGGSRQQRVKNIPPPQNPPPMRQLDFSTTTTHTCPSYVQMAFMSVPLSSPLLFLSINRAGWFSVGFSAKTLAANAMTGKRVQQLWRKEFRLYLVCFELRANMYVYYVRRVGPMSPLRLRRHNFTGDNYAPNKYAKIFVVLPV